MTRWSVWVGGVEVNDHYYSEKENAERMASACKRMGYDDVFIEEVQDV